MKIRVKRAKPKRPNFIKNHAVELREWASPVFVVFIISSIFVGACIKYKTDYMFEQYNAQRQQLNQVRTMEKAMEIQAEETRKAEEEETESAFRPIFAEDGSIDLLKSHVQTMDQAPMKEDMKELYDMNPDIVGWVSINDMVIDYPVMQTPDDEEYYLDRDFDGNYSAYGCILMDTDSQVGSGTIANEYADGSIPCTNLILHGHNMKNGSMFGSLDKFRQESFEKEHNIIKFSSLYEDREYEIISVFTSQVYLKTQTDVFKYYNFFQANTEQQFDYFYKNIKDAAMYDTGVTAEFGDEFITLSVCAYHVENGRLVVVGKRIK